MENESRPDIPRPIANGKPTAPTSSGTEDLPASNSPTLQLLRATPSEILAIRRSNAEEWRGALSAPAYLRREAHLASQALTSHGGLQTWILSSPLMSGPTTDATDAATEIASARRVLSSCETFRKRGLLGRGGEVSDIVIYGVGSVFCPPELRRRGYAGRMMRELSLALRGFHDEAVAKGGPGACSVLYSDIGRLFYARRGWSVFPSSHVALRATGDGGRGPRAGDGPPVKPLSAGDVRELCEADEAALRTSLRQITDGRTYLALIPDHATIAWHHAREDFVSCELRGARPAVKGALVDLGVEGRVWCYFARMFYNGDPGGSEGNTLHILRLVVEKRGMYGWECGGEGEELKRYTDAIAALFEFALGEAREWNMQEVVFWNPTTVVVEAARRLDPEAQVVEREEESICSLMSFGGGDDGTRKDEVVWLGNEKYGWC